MGSTVSSEGQEPLLLTSDRNTQHNYGSFFSYRFFRNGVAASSKVQNYFFLFYALYLGYFALFRLKITDIRISH